MKTEREYNYDLLRVVSMLAVIVIHVSALWVNGFSEYISEGMEIKELTSPISACIYNTISRFAVPCFIMLSGAFILDDERTENYQEFYSKKLMKIGIPTVIFSILYILYKIPINFIKEQSGIAVAISLLKDVVKGSPFYHMWYLYMLIGIYLLAPVVFRFKNSISYKDFRKIVYIFLIVASLSKWTGSVRVNWDVGQAFEYLGYFMVGYVIRKDVPKSNYKGFLFILMGVIIEIITAFIEYEFQIKRGIAESDLKFGIVGPYCPMIVIASLLIFIGFTMLDIKYNRWISKLAKMSFIIYLFHAGVYHFITNIVKIIEGKDYLLKFNNIYWIPIFTIVVFIISVCLTIIYNKIETYFYSKNLENGKIM